MGKGGGGGGCVAINMPISTEGSGSPVQGLGAGRFLFFHLIAWGVLYAPSDLTIIHAAVCVCGWVICMHVCLFVCLFVLFCFVLFCFVVVAAAAVVTPAVQHMMK